MRAQAPCRRGRAPQTSSAARRRSKVRRRRSPLRCPRPAPDAPMPMKCASTPTAASPAAPPACWPSVHRLAWHYHWSEAEILALPRGRRAHYLALIDAARGMSQ
ncbi:MAG: hypothetical protein MZW92_65580 [Comamonadaceae bacterium]|nr:hypothetical protein [Comamonadaceae bacterium]